MQRIGFIVFAIGLISLSSCANAQDNAENKTRPNILFCLADDASFLLIIPLTFPLNQID